MLEDANSRILAQDLRGSCVPREMAKLGVKALRNDDFADLLTGDTISFCTALEEESEKQSTSYHNFLNDSQGLLRTAVCRLSSKGMDAS